MSVCEALSNLVFAAIPALSSVKASCNWMWPAKVSEQAGADTAEVKFIVFISKQPFTGALRYHTRN
jgi:hypothetical protein